MTNIVALYNNIDYRDEDKYDTTTWVLSTPVYKQQEVLKQDIGVLKYTRSK